MNSTNQFSSPIFTFKNQPPDFSANVGNSNTYYACTKGGATKLLEVLSNCRVSASTTYHEKQLDIATLDCLDNEDEFLQERKLSFFSLTLDNLDFEKPGPNATSVGYVAMNAPVFYGTADSVGRYPYP